MKDFVFSNTTKVYFGKDQLHHLSEEIAKFGKKVLLVYGGGSIKRIGLYDKVMAELKKADMTVFELGGVEPNPHHTTVNKGAALCKKEGIDVLLAVGGGSTIDATKAMADSGLALDEIHHLPDLLAVAADGQNLTMEIEKTDELKDVRWLNHRGETLYRSHKTPNTFEEELTLPGSSSNYMPAYSFSSEKTEKESSFSLDVSWDKVAEETSENENMPETLLRIKANIDHLPAEFPVDSDFSGRAKVEGIFLPNFDYLIHGVVAGVDGSVKLTLSNPDKPDAEPVFTVTGQFTPVSYGGPLEYMIGDIITDYSLFDLTDDTLAELVETVFPAVMDKVPDFVYAIPIHSVQSILDTLEKYRLLQVLIK